MKVMLQKELPSIIWNMFDCISKDREKNFVSGLSNGGYGCLHTILKYPDKFSKSRGIFRWR